jgi:phage major tail protein, phi13 family
MINKKKPPIKETVGAQYICFSTPDEDGTFNATYDESVERTDVVKNVSVSENSESTVVRASGIDYEDVSTSSGVEIAVEVVAFPAETLAKMRGEIIDKNGLITTVLSPKRPYFAYGKVVKLKGGVVRYEWYPKCMLSNNTDDIATSEESFSEQNDTLTIRAMAFNDDGAVKQSIAGDYMMPAGLTEEKFFSKPILNSEDLASVIGVE